MEVMRDIEEKVDEQYREKRKTIEMKIVRVDYIKSEKLEEKLYEALRRPKIPSDREWNEHGRRYNIRGLYNLVRNSEKQGIKIYFDPPEIIEEIKLYEEKRNSERIK